MPELIFREIPDRQGMHLCGPWRDYSTIQTMRMSDQELAAVIANTWADKYLVRAAMWELVCRRYLALPVEKQSDEAMVALWAEHLPI